MRTETQKQVIPKMPKLRFDFTPKLVYGLEFGTCKFTLRLTIAVRVAQSVGLLTRKSGILGSIPGLATYFRFSFRFFKKGSCQLLAKVCA